MSIEGWDGPIHPAADLFPLIDGDEFESLVDSVRREGLRESVWVTKSGELLDGRNRVRACYEAGIKPVVREYAGDDPVAFVMALNLERRHLTVGQRAMIALQLVPMYEAEAKVRESLRKSKVTVADRQQSWESKSVSRAGVAAKVSGRAVARAKRVAEHAPDLAEKVKTGEVALDKAEKQLTRRLKDAEEQQAREIVMAEVPADATGNGWRMYAGDFRERLNELPDGCVDLIVTDPPYPAVFMHLWSDLSRHAARVLKPQGIIVALSGKIHLPDVMSRLGENLSYGWTYAQPLPQQNTRILARHTLQEWKPWLAYSNGSWPSGAIEWHGDMLDPSDRAKKHYRWEQDGNPSRYLIEMLCPEGGMVLDPYCGSGSYGIAALSMGRQFIGVEADHERFQLCVERLGNVDVVR